MYASLVFHSNCRVIYVPCNVQNNQFDVHVIEESLRFRTDVFAITCRQNIKIRSFH